MTTLDDLSSLFPDTVPLRPEAHYAHIIMLRVSESYPIFRTDGDLNTARVAAGRTDKRGMDRIAMFLRKQTTAERLRGRELLRGAGVLPEECRYNENPCGRCPDCVTYGYAIGDSGAEKSKVYSDTAYSLSDHATSHEVRTFNAPGETGTMYDQATASTSNRINSTEYVKPGVVFPAVLTVRDLTFPLFCYVLNNLLSTQRYGATTTRTGRIDNQVIGIVIGNGEIMSNLAFTQAIYDDLNAKGQWNAANLPDTAQVHESVEGVLNTLLQEANIQVQQAVVAAELDMFLTEFRTTVSQNPVELFNRANVQANEYSVRLREKPAAKGKRAR